MPDKNYPRTSDIRRGAAVLTIDGPGVIIGKSMRKNTNGGPGTRQYVVKLSDKRIRHYSFLVVAAGVKSLPAKSRAPSRRAQKPR